MEKRVEQDEYTAGVRGGGVNIGETSANVISFKSSRGENWRSRVTKHIYTILHVIFPSIS